MQRDILTRVKFILQSENNCQLWVLSTRDKTVEKQVFVIKIIKKIKRRGVGGGGGGRPGKVEIRRNLLVL